jgi:hypothetical protein
MGEYGLAVFFLDMVIEPNAVPRSRDYIGQCDLMPWVRW